MSICITKGIGQYVALESHIVAKGRLYKPDATKRPIIYFTGGPGDSMDFLTASSSGSQITPRLVDLGVVVASAEFGGASLWGNDTSQTRIGQLWTYLKTLGVKTDKFVGVGVSKGATALLNYARNNPSQVAALFLNVPALNVTDIHDNNRSGLAAAIETAYGGSAGWAAAAPTHDPAQNISTHAAQSIPMKAAYGEADTTCLGNLIVNFMAGVGGEAISKGNTDHLTTAPALDPIEDVWKFLAPYL